MLLGHRVRALISSTGKAVGFFLQGKYNKRVLLCDSTCSRADRKGPNGVGVSVAVAVIVVAASVAAGPHKDAALPLPPVSHAVDEGPAGEITGAVHRLAVIVRTPGGTEQDNKIKLSQQ